MIANERQYRITKAWAEKFEDGAEHMKEDRGERDPAMQQIFYDAYVSQAQELREQLAEYEALHSGRIDVLELGSLAELPEALIRARIAAGLTQKELAARLGLKEQQIQRYEATRYAGASLGRIQAVAEALGIRARGQIILPTAAGTEG